MLLRAVVTIALAFVSILIFTTPVAAQDPPPEGWTGKVALGGSISRGTSDSLDGAVDAVTERTWDPHLLRLGAYASYGSTNQKGTKPQVSNNKQEVFEYYRYTFNERFFWYGDALQGRDPVQSVRFRLLANSGPGWRAWYVGDKQYLDLELGVGYRFEDRLGDDNRDDTTGRAAMLFEHPVGPGAFLHDTEFLMPFNEVAAWIWQGKTSLSFPLSESWAFENTLLTSYDNKPAESTKNFELDYIVSLVYSF